MTKISDDLAERGVEVLKRISVSRMPLADASFIAQWVHDARQSLRAQASPAPVSEEMVEAGLEYYSEGGCSGLESHERREVVRNIIEAALAAKGRQ